MIPSVKNTYQKERKRERGNMFGEIVVIFKVTKEKNGPFQNLKTISHRAKNSVNRRESKPEKTARHSQIADPVMKSRKKDTEERRSERQQTSHQKLCKPKEDGMISLKC